MRTQTFSAVAFFGDIESSNATGIRRVTGRPSGGERIANADGFVCERSGFEKLRADCCPDQVIFPKVDFDVGELKQLEQLQAANGRGAASQVP